MTIALRAPSIIQNFVSVDNAPIDAALLSDFGKYIQGMQKIEDAGVTRQAEADEILRDFETSLPIRQFLLGNLYRPSDEKTQKFKVPLKILASALDNLGDFPYKDPEEVRFGKPSLFVRGTKSKYVPDEALPIIGRFFPRFELVDINAGHWVISENPEDFRRGMRSEPSGAGLMLTFHAAVVEFLKPKE
jgi:pimeloyl-ACP methyl ester carboxylesterase